MRTPASEAADVVAGARGTARIAVTDEANDVWLGTNTGHRITVQRRKLFDTTSRVFAIGSCFAQEIRAALGRAGIAADPRYEGLAIDKTCQMAGPLAHVNYYTTFGIRQELERALEPGARKYPVLPIREGAMDVRGEWTARWQDPHRHSVVALDESSMTDLVEKFHLMMREAIERADVFVLTLGLVESWVDRETGNHVWAVVARNLSPDPDRFVFHQSDYAENLEALRWICRILQGRFPGKPIVLSVSPVALQRTFSGRDLMVANSYSKSVLRAVAGVVASEFEDVIYWPSYELALAGRYFREDGRHVRRDAVDHIVSQFIAAHGPG